MAPLLQQPWQWGHFNYSPCCCAFVECRLEYGLHWWQLWQWLLEQWQYGAQCLAVKSPAVAEQRLEYVSSVSDFKHRKPLSVATLTYFEEQIFTSVDNTQMC